MTRNLSWESSNQSYDRSDIKIIEVFYNNISGKSFGISMKIMTKGKENKNAGISRRFGNIRKK